MSKKIDIKRTLGKQQPPLSIEDVEEMTRLIHKKNEATMPSAAVTPPKMNVVETPTAQEPAAVKTTNYEKNTAFVAQNPTVIPETPQTDKGKRGRKPKSIMETERLLRVSVDLPESLFIQLKIAVIQQQTDMKSYIRQLVAKDILS